MRPLRVALVAGHGVVGGAEVWLLRQLDSTSRVEVRALTLQHGPLVEQLSSRSIAVDTIEVGNQPQHIPGAVARTWAWLRASDADVVLANGIKAACVAVPASRLAGIPVVWAKHDHMYDDELARPLAKLADGLVAAVEELAEPTGRADAVIVPVPRPDVPPASRGEARAFWSTRGVPDNDRLLVAMVGRLTPYKGVEDAVLALARSGAADWDLVVVGDDDPSTPGERERLERVAVDSGLADRVVFTGAVPDASHWLAAMDACAVLTKPAGSRTPSREGFGTSAFEAMLAGVPVIAVEGGAVVRRLEGRAGIGVPANDPGAVADALRALTPSAARAAAGAAAREIVADFPDASACASRLVSFLAATSRRPGAGAAARPAISVITTVRDEAAGVGALLDALVAQLGPDDEIVVVDGGSTDDTVELMRAHPSKQIVVVEAPGAGISEGRNIAVRTARHEFVACTDAGCRPQPGWLDALRAGFTDDGEPSLVTGLYHVTSASALQEAFALSCYPTVEEARRSGPLTRLYSKLLGRSFDARLSTGRSMAFTKQAWASVGGFPEGLATAEDVGFGLAIARGGGSCVLASDAIVDWDQRADLRSTARMYYRYGVGDGRSRDPVLVGRNVARGAAYVLGPLLALQGRPSRALVAGAATFYLSVPVQRAARRRATPAAWALVPVALAVKDIAKAAGCVVGWQDPYQPSSGREPR